MKLPPILYHGTSDGYLEAILRDGLVPDSAGNGFLCYTDAMEVAVHHAKCMAEWDEGKLGRPCRPIVFAVPIAAFDVEGFVLEENYVRIGPSGGRACNEAMTAHIRARHATDPWRWDEMLAYAGAVGYARVLKVDAPMMRLVSEEADVPLARPIPGS